MAALSGRDEWQGADSGSHWEGGASESSEEVLDSTKIDGTLMRK